MKDQKTARVNNHSQLLSQSHGQTNECLFKTSTKKYTNKYASARRQKYPFSIVRNKLEKLILATQHISFQLQLLNKNANYS